MGSTGKELWIRRLDENAKWTPHHEWVRIPKPNWETEGYYSITWRNFANASNKIAHWLDEKLGKSMNNDTIAYFGPNDIRYPFIFAALNKSNRKLLAPDGRIVKEGLASLLEATNCEIWLYPQDCKDLHASLGVNDMSVTPVEFPSLEWCLDAENATPYPFEKEYENSKYEEIVIIHTSGTTGTPKPIFVNYGFWAAGCSSSLLALKNHPRGISTDAFHGRCFIMACPLRWNAGLVMTCMFGVFDKSVCVLPAADLTGLPPHVFEGMCRQNRIEGLVAPPFSIVELYNDTSTQQVLMSLEFITYLGAVLDRKVGDVLCEHTRLNSVIGSTERGACFSLNPADRKLWYTYDFVPESHSRLVRIEGAGEAENGPDGSDVFKLFVDRPPNGEPSLTQNTFWNVKMFGSDQTIDTKELYKPVKDSDGRTRWEFVSRTDDFMKLASLTRFKGQYFENRIRQYPGVEHVLLGGNGRDAVYAIIQVKDESLQSKTGAAILDDIYEKMIPDLNQEGTREVGILREMMILAKKDKPFPVNWKHEIIRRQVEADYEEEVECAYESLKTTGENVGLKRFMEFMK